MRAHELTEQTLEEASIKEKIGAILLAAFGIGAISKGVLDHYKQELGANPVQVIHSAHELLQPERIILRAALDAKMAGDELAQFLAHTAHESMGFTRMHETPDDSDPHFHKYEKRYNPTTAKLLGNTEDGDGELFHGRGYIQLTGRYNYDKAGKALGLDLVNNPDLAAEPKHAARIAVWYWKSRVGNTVKKGMTATTRKINAGLSHLDRRRELYKKYKKDVDDAEQTNEDADDEQGGEGEESHKHNLIPFPKGTVKVGVRDVYDWYKLGTHINDLDDADPKDFGTGPPQTMLSFGSEEEEHRYMRDLKRLGMDITDLDE